MRRIKIHALTLKKQFLILVLVMACINLVAQDKVPDNIKIQFMDDYISASGASWSKVDEKYLVSFKHQSHFKTATYSSNGTRLLLETKLMSLAQVPQAVFHTVTRRYKSYMIDDIWQTESMNEVAFRLLIRSEEKVYSLEFFQTGKLKNKTRLFPERT